MAVATARRRSELHSLTVEDGHIRWEPGGVRLIPQAGFLTKNQSSDFLPPDVFVADLKSFLAVDADKLWCPSGTIVYYFGPPFPASVSGHYYTLADYSYLLGPE